MALEQLKVHEIVKQALGKSVDIPEFQREFVWDPEKVKKLAESLYRDYPVGSFLLWDSSNYQESKTAQGSVAALWIVDGQQRTTALCLLLGQKPYWWSDAQNWNESMERYDVMVNILPDDDDERLEFSLPNPVRKREPRWLSIRSVLCFDKVDGLTSYARQIAKGLVDGPDPENEILMQFFAKVHPRLLHIWEIRNRDIPVVKIAHEVEDVAEIFARLNQEGTRVKEADVVLAMAAVRNPGWVREKYLPFRSDLEDRGWDLDAGIFVRTMTGIGHGRARLVEVPKQFWRPENLIPIWNLASQTITEVLLKRFAEYGIFSTELLPSSNSLIPLFVLHHRWGSHQGYSFGRALHWFLLANRDGRYSGAAINSLNEDVRAIMSEAQDFDQALHNLMKRLHVSEATEADDFLKRYDRWGGGRGFPRLMLYLLLVQSGARDWVDGTKIGYDKTGVPIAAGFEPQWHHIFARTVLKKAGEPEDYSNALANITVVNERTNVNKLSGKPPARYIQQFHITGESLQAHFVPQKYAGFTGKDQLEQLWDVKRFQDFLIERADLLAQASNAFLQNLVRTH